MLCDGDSSANLRDVLAEEAVDKRGLARARDASQQDVRLLKRLRHLNIT